MAAKSIALTASLSACLWMSLLAICASSHLRGGPTFPSDRVSLEEVQRSLLDEINEALGVTYTDGHLQEVEMELGDVYTALPKNRGGFLGHTTVRYALHRFFVEKHGWYFRGLEPAGGAWNSSSPTVLLKDRVPAYIQSLIEEQLDGRGFTLRELTVFAASLEHLILNEAKDRLNASYEALDLSQHEAQPETKVEKALDVFMMDFLIGGNFTVRDPSDLSNTEEKMKYVYPKWEKLQEFLREVRRNFTASISPIDEKAGPRSGMDFALATKVAADAGKQLGRWQDSQCRALKDQLLALGDRQVGRVSLSDFYKSALDGAVRGDSIDYLRQLGSLDESVPSKPTVVVANYINSPANCIASSSFYSVCCTNECEAILRKIEQSIASPVAQPAQIEKLVIALPSSSISAPRELPAALRERLQQIAQQHDGEVPLHGRLFSQWLHHAYPRECPYPHVAGSIRPQSADEWMAETGKQCSSTRSEMVEFITNAEGSFEDDEEEGDSTDEIPDLPWSDNEELLVIKPTLPSSEELNKKREPAAIFRIIFFAVALLSMLFMVQENLTGAVRAVRAASQQGLPLKGKD